MRKQTIFNINTHFMIRTTNDEFKSSTTIIPQGNLTIRDRRHAKYRQNGRAVFYAVLLTNESVALIAFHRC